MRKELAVQVRRGSVPKSLVLNFDQTGIHFLQTRGASWMEREEDDDPTISSRPGREKEKKMQGLKDKRQATATIGLSANADLLPAQLIVAGEPHCIGALPLCSVGCATYLLLAGRSCHQQGSATAILAPYLR